MRLEYETAGLAEADLAVDPFAQFDRWFAEAVSAEVYEPNAMVVSTVDGDGYPSSRTVLLKGVSDRGFEFFTNYESNKSRQLSSSPVAAITFAWLGLHRQVNIIGSVEQLSAAESDAYWEVRTRGSQIGGWASDQSRVVDGRAVLTESYRAAEERFPDTVPRPPHWGGWRVAPRSVEFWQGRQNRMHDRLRFSRTADADGSSRWLIERLSP